MGARHGDGIPNVLNNFAMEFVAALVASNLLPQAPKVMLPGVSAAARRGRAQRSRDRACVSRLY